MSEIVDNQEARSLGSAVMSLCGQISALRPGERAELRSEKSGSAFWRVLHASGLSEVKVWVSEGAKRDLARIIAILIGTTENANLHDPETDLGRAIFASGVSPNALERMLSAEPKLRREMMERIARRMARESPRVNVYQLGDLILRTEPDSVIRKIASSYYRAEHKEKSTEEKEGTKK